MRFCETRSSSKSSARPRARRLYRSSPIPPGSLGSFFGRALRSQLRTLTSPNPKGKKVNLAVLQLREIALFANFLRGRFVGTKAKKKRWSVFNYSAFVFVYGFLKAFQRSIMFAFNCFKRRAFVARRYLQRLRRDLMDLFFDYFFFVD